MKRSTILPIMCRASCFYALVLTSYVLLFFPSCNNPFVPPDRKFGPDTTSHTFTWRVDTLGDGNSSILNDVFIIDENNIWAVGEIYLRDSTGQFETVPYNAAVWNGSSWMMKRITVKYNGNLVTPPLEGIFAFSATDIWAVGSFPIHGNGSSWTLYHLQDMGLSVSVSKAWGSSSSNMYFVGRQGSIAHYNGGSWQKIETGISDPGFTVSDVWGLNTPEFVLAVGSDLVNGSNHHVFAISQLGVTDTLGWTMDKTPFSVWFTNPLAFFISGNGVWEHREGNWIEVVSMNFVNRVKGSSENNVFAGGSFAYIAHYNGSTWKEYPTLRLTNGVLRGLAVHPRIVVAVGDI